MKSVLIALSFLIAISPHIVGCVGKRGTEPANAYYEYARFRMERDKGDIKEALRLIAEAMKADPRSKYLQMEAASVFMLQKDHVRGLEIIRKILSKDPDNIQALMFLAEIKRAEKKFGEAKKTCRKIIKKAPDNKNIRVLLAQIFVEEEDLTGALKVLENMVKTFPESYSGHYLMGLLYSEMGKTDHAERKFNRSLELEPDKINPVTELLKIYKKQGRDADISNTYKKLLKQNPDDTITAMRFGLHCYKKGQKDKSEEIFRKLGKKSAKNPRAVWIVLQLYIQNKKYDDALAILGGMLKGHPESRDIHYAMGLAHDAKKDSESALFHFKMLKKGDAFYNNAVANVSFLYQEMGKIRQGIEYLENVVSETDNVPDFFLYLGSFYEQVKNYKKAAAALKKGIKLSPENADLYFRLGIVYDKAGEQTKSLNAMKNVIRLEPKNSNALNYLGYTYALLGINLGEAERLIKLALRQEPDDGYITDSLGWVYFKKGEFKKALDTLERANELAANEPVILEHLGDVHLEMKDKKNALKFYKRCLDVQKTKKTIEKIKKKIKDLL